MHRQKQFGSDELMQFLDKEQFEESNFIDYTHSPNLNLYNLHLLKNKYQHELKIQESTQFRDNILKSVDTKLLYSKNKPITDPDAPIKMSIRSNMQRFRRYKAQIHSDEQPHYLSKQQKFGFSHQVKEITCPLEIKTKQFTPKQVKYAESMPLIYRSRLNHGFRGLQ